MRFDHFLHEHIGWAITAAVLVTAAATLVVTRKWNPFSFRESFRQLLGIDLDSLAYGKEDGIGILTFYAGFVAAQQTVLGLATRGKGEQYLYPLAIGLLSAATIYGICRTLRFTNGNATTVRGYNRSTIVFGRWVLVVSSCLSMAIVAGAMLGLLPDQNPDRKDYEQPTVEVIASKMDDHFPANVESTGSSYIRYRQNMTRWYKWLQDGYRAMLASRTDAKNEYWDFLWIEQARPFADDYKTFSAVLSVRNDATIVEKVAFLEAPNDSSLFRPELRQLRFLLDPVDGLKETNEVEFHVPNRGERIWILAWVTTKNEIKTIDDWQVKVTTKPRELVK